MKKYSVTISLLVDDFMADNDDMATAMVEKYIDHLVAVCEVNDGGLTWGEVDYSVAGAA